MRIEVKGRNVSITPAQREQIERRFSKIERQVSERAWLELELTEERTGAHEHVAEAALHLKGVTLRAHARGSDLAHAVHCCEEQMAKQVKRHRDKRRKRREARSQHAAAYGAAEAGM